VTLFGLLAALGTLTPTLCVVELDPVEDATTEHAASELRAVARSIARRPRAASRASHRLPRGTIVRASRHRARHVSRSPSLPRRVVPDGDDPDERRTA
jgi:hypothetical protein